MADRTEATLLDKLLFAPVLAKVLISTLFRAITLPLTSLTGAAKANKPMKDILFAALRTQLSSINAAQEQWTLTTTTEKNYLEFAGKEKLQPQSTVLNSGLRLHWLGPKTSDKVIVFFHGGGYVLPMSDGHFKWLLNLQVELSEKTSTSVIIVGYTLAPYGQFPKQLQQAAETLAWLIGKQKRRPRDIIIAGDSAGGNMALSLISHVIHPHPDAVKIDLNEPLAATVLISPWSRFDADYDSWKRNAKSDMLPPEATYRWSSLFLGSKPANSYSEAWRADEQWWSGLDKVTSDLLVWGGSAEVLIDSINEVGKQLKVAHPKTEIVIQKGASHEDFIIDVLLGYKHKAEGSKVIESWLSERI
ncbi:hypothetical protein DOTSEDRAFT_144320 [Dothistroma septosporum NZE10]|uniref:Alpha/beta hydrolase fold-3 domain-containing protein n=1 Tax=Dothistroma septosporum (strain NZE10 / CBS 128990) TaxID=675120 RepID=N1Q4U2_DOTSN|nr:hypothetical protein DOTSEDRAFT_144320 [Dothistroma septosporum NZE10]